MKPGVIKEMTTEELHDRLTEEQDLLAKMKMNHAVSQIENPLKIRQSRRTVARLKTEIKNRELKEQSNN